MSALKYSMLPHTSKMMKSVFGLPGPYRSGRSRVPRPTICQYFVCDGGTTTFTCPEGTTDAMEGDLRGCCMTTTDGGAAMDIEQNGKGAVALRLVNTCGPITVLAQSIDFL